MRRFFILVIAGALLMLTLASGLSPASAAVNTPAFSAADKQSTAVAKVYWRRHGYWHRPYRYYGYRPYWRRYSYYRPYRYYGYRPILRLLAPSLLAGLRLSSALLAPLVTDHRFTACAFIGAEGWNRLDCGAIFEIAEV